MNKMYWELFCSFREYAVFNSSYILLQQSQNEILNQDDKTEADSQYDLLEKSIDKMKEEIEKMKNNKH